MAMRMAMASHNYSQVSQVSARQEVVYTHVESRDPLYSVHWCLDLLSEVVRVSPVEWRPALRRHSWLRMPAQRPHHAGVAIA